MLLALATFLLVVLLAVGIMLLTVVLSRAWMKIGSPNSPKLGAPTETRAKHA